MIKHVSFKYDSEKRPLVDRWFEQKRVEGIDASEAIRRLIEGDTRRQDEILIELKEIKAKLNGYRPGTPIASGPREEAALIDIGEIEREVQQVEERQEIKEINKLRLRERYLKK